uniref:Uncharacterized protein n=1 Tax=Glossina pallidipes TaxID=7398 RepID=A0A1A9ZLE2_GLOPL
MLQISVRNTVLAIFTVLLYWFHLKECDHDASAKRHDGSNIKRFKLSNNSEVEALCSKFMDSGVDDIVAVVVVVVAVVVKLSSSSSSWLFLRFNMAACNSLEQL